MAHGESRETADDQPATRAAGPEDRPCRAGSGTIGSQQGSRLQTKNLLAIVCVIGTFVIIYVLLQQKANEIADKYRNHPIVVEQLGGIDSCSYNFHEGSKRTKVYDVQGPKGSGQIVTHEALFLMVSVKLRTSDGEWELLD